MTGASFDPALPAVRTAYTTEPLLMLSDPPIELASFRPRSGLHLDRRIDFAAIGFSMLLQVVVAEIHIRLEHGDDSGWKRATPNDGLWEHGKFASLRIFELDRDRLSSVANQCRTPRTRPPGVPSTSTPGPRSAGRAGPNLA